MLSFIFGKSSKQDYTCLGTNEDGQKECEGCRNIKILLRRKKNLEEGNPYFSAPLRCRIHWTWRELVSCAKHCIGCQYIQRAFVLRQLTIDSFITLQDPGNTGEIWVELPRSKPSPTFSLRESVKLAFSIRTLNPESTASILATAEVSCTHAFSHLPPNVSRNPMSPQVFGRIKGWLNDCHDNHDQCAKLGWSLKNPTNLIKILVNTENIQLISGRSIGYAKYAALTYTWGKERARRKVDVDRIEGNQTTFGNKARRQNPFPRTDLSKTIQDVVRLCEHLGIHYLWVDALCIPEDADWNDEGSKMHEVYGNAHLTISVSSIERATDPLFLPRVAWHYPPVPCRLNGMYLVNHALPPEDIRLNSPVSARAWTLQEERLSPRILYWTSHMAYWFCLCAQHDELEPSPTRIRDQGLPQRPLHSSFPAWPDCTQPSEPAYVPQQFLFDCRTNPGQQVHDGWSSLIEDYVQRSLFRGTDRFPALSGLAVQYLTANRFFTTNDSLTRHPEEYVAGLWRGTFAADLVWSVMPSPRACSDDEHLRSEAPSWSWASLPLKTKTSIGYPGFKEAECFHLLSVTFKAGYKRKEHLEDPLELVKQGALVNAVKVRGRLRTFVSNHSAKLPWETVQWVANGNVRIRNSAQGSATMHAGANNKSYSPTRKALPIPFRDPEASEEDRFDFRSFIDLDVHARDATSGRVLGYEAHKQEVVGQLDYALLQPVTPVKENNDPMLRKICEVSIYVDSGEQRVSLLEGEEADLWCLEVGTGAMLLLQVAPEITRSEFQGARVFRRAGVCRGFRSNFFAEASAEEVWLI